ncbi:LPXTG cell wall anchor domain-containing protein, partial [Pseudolactococcus laudensis]|nr:LPXTG cell wall anchor domain-containing protein [Lactococcus laudensis]
GGLPTTLGNAVKALLPNTGEGKLAVTSMLGLIVSLSVFLVVKNRKKETPPTKE